jgi:hypothetical protein
MGGLLEKAHRARGREGDPQSDPGTSEISVQERVDILAQIEDVVAQSRTPVTPETLAYTPRRSGLLFPLLLNILAAVVIASAAWFFPAFFNRQEKTITGSSGTAIAGESALVSTVKAEAEASLRTKDQQIGQIQGALAQTTKRIDALKAEADARVLQKEQELRESFNGQLAEERKKLQGQGGSAASVESQLAQVRDQLQKASDAALADFRRQVQAETARKEAGLTAEREGSQKALTQAQAEKAALQAQVEASSRTATAAQGEQARLAKQVETLSEQNQKEQLVLDQISASYAQVGAAMDQRRYDDALGSLAALSGYLDQQNVAALPAVQRRKPVDIFLIDALGKLAVSMKGGTQAGNLPAASPRQTQALAAAIAEGDALYAAGNYAGALDRYAGGLALLNDVPGIAGVAGRIAEAGHRQGMADLVARADRAARPTLEKAETLSKKGSYAEAIASYATLVRTWPDSTYVTRSLGGIESSLSALLKKKDDEAARSQEARQTEAARAEEARRTAAGDKIAAVTAGLSAPSRTADASLAAAQKELITLLDAKVKVKTVLGSDTVKAQYPDLAKSLDRYLQLYGESASLDGRVMALQDVSTVLDYLLGAKGADALSPVVSRYGDQNERAALRQILDRLRTLSAAP